ncbi:receptor-like serine/threonine-protein kinase At4g25390 [Amaranthus tricolor]|uniref:receptor-like serine/threonine-protein kinase At4g25390 n=1 Tax=Amaranthus tricolor TaxID=29722 RepID=UPI00258C720C|nr:receptor-like serine/threonine-protein kinase At4g25390 [Amaranthus tricolor]
MSSSSPSENFLSPPHHHRHNHHFNRLIPPLLASAFFCCLLIIFVTFFRRFYKCLKPPRQSLSLSSPHRFSFSQLRRATSSFSSSNRLGQGGFGSVYSGTLPLSKKHKLPIAVKLLDCGSLQGEREFQNELLIANKLVNSDNNKIVKLLGFASDPKRRRMCLVYELMRNGNLQDCLLHRKCDELMIWSKRFSIAIEVAQGLTFLHHQCQPPIIHGDVKPSNVLLDDCFHAKIADFGLARLKLGEINDGFVVNFDCNIANNDNVNVNVDVVGLEDSLSVMETESATTTVGFEEGSVGIDRSPVRIVDTSPEMVTAKTSPSEFFDNKGFDLEAQFGLDNVGKDVGKRHNENLDGNVQVNLEAQFGRVDNRNREFCDDNAQVDLEAQFGRVDMENIGKEVRKGRNGNGNGNGKVKDYVMEWMGMDVGREGDHSDWNKGGASSSNVVSNKGGKTKERKLEWWVAMEDGWMTKKKRRPVREWWREDYSDKLARKKKKKKKNKNKIQEVKSDNEENWWPRDDEMYVDKKKKYSRSRKSSRSSVDWWLDGFSGDLWKARHTSYDSMSGDIPKSGGVSSTPSMRGTVCYIAPEYGSGGDLSEKCDVYSFGVLLLVLIAGRRPLQVTGSPMSEFHKANLVSWARQLARSGRLLDLVDKKTRSLNKEEAQLCIIVALMCLQKSPSRRPTMKEVVGMLTGELAPPQLPVEYTKSPAPYKSRKKYFR